MYIDRFVKHAPFYGTSHTLWAMATDRVAWLVCLCVCWSRSWNPIEMRRPAYPRKHVLDETKAKFKGFSHLLAVSAMV